MSRIKLFLSSFLIIGLAHAGGRSAEPNLMDAFFEQQETAATPQPGARSQRSLSQQSLSTSSITASATALSTAACPLQQLAADSDNNALVFHNQPMLAADAALDTGNDDTRFSFRAVLQSIIDSSPQTGTTPLALFTSMLDNYQQPTATNGNVTMDLTPQTPGTTDRTALFNAMRPTALFNRFDLSPKTGGAHCGEYRAVFSKDTAAQPGNRFLVIFEATYPNPAPGLGSAGCWPVADYWASLQSLTDTEALEKLRAFYFTGVVHNGVYLPPVFQYAHYSAGAGQVRVNSFLNPFPDIWQLREFKTSTTATDTVFVPETVKANALAELYTDSVSSVAGVTSISGDSGNTLVQAFVDDFTNDFIAEYIAQLTHPEAMGFSSANAIINGVALDNDDRYNEFQSDAQGGQDNIASLASAGFKAEIAPAAPAGVTADHIINRASAMSCGGCHQLSAGRPIANNVTWPLSLGFVHVSEAGQLSPALLNNFLPARAAVLEMALCDPNRSVDYSKVQSVINGLLLD